MVFFSSKRSTGLGIVSAVRCSSSSNQRSTSGIWPTPGTGSHPKMFSVDPESTVVAAEDDDEGAPERTLVLSCASPS